MKIYYIKQLILLLMKNLVIKTYLYNAQELILEIKYNVSDEINELIDIMKLPFRVSRYSNNY